MKTNYDVNYAIDSFVNDYISNKDVKTIMKDKLIVLRRELISYYILSNIVYDPIKAKDFVGYDKKAAKIKIKEVRKNIKSINRDNKMLKKEINNLRKGLK